MGTNTTVAACAGVSTVLSGTGTLGVPGLPSASYISWPCAALGPAVMVMPAIVPSTSLPPRGTPTGVSSVTLAMLPGVAVGASLTGVTVTVTVLVVVPPWPSLTVTVKLSVPL